ncbi:MAG: diguanylate cyclase [Anaerolineales bacterium]|jgi:diguanylate cyclase (GGDEF)-like protein
MPTLSSELLRIDPLTGCKNFLGFLEAVLDCLSSDLPKDVPTSEIIASSVVKQPQYSAILFVEMNHMRFLNKTKGRSHGDSAIRWMGILLAEESNQNAVYRLGGSEFAVLLRLGSYNEHSQFVERIQERMNREAESLGFPDSPADMALIIYDEAPSLESMLMQMGEAMIRVKNSGKSRTMIFNATDFKIPAQSSLSSWKPENDSDASFAVRWLSRKNIHQVLEMGKTLDKVREEAYTDAISGLPNMKAALRSMEKTLENFKANQGSFSILMIDGDNIRLYNNINYAAGDEMIRDMSVVFKNNLRPNDFIARWRTGDEFVVILPETTKEGAKIIGERFRLAIKEASKSWLFPTTISIGVASYPLHGENINTLIDKAESANKHAKDQGKDQVVLAD